MSSDQPLAIEMTDSVDTSDLVHPDVQRYIHKALQTPDTIRVLELLPGSSESALSCRILEIDRTHSDIEFEAISYAWGSHIPACYLHDAKSNSLVHITESLYLALKAMRYRDRSRILWADAVCINQSDNDEKSHQVRNMGSIYATANMVLVWLGDEDFSGAFKVLKGLGKAPENGTSTANLKLTDPVDNVIMAVLSVIGTPWFTRLWTIQEFVLATDVRFCASNQHISGNVLEKAIENTSIKVDWLNTTSSRALDIYNNFSMVQNLFSFRTTWQYSPYLGSQVMSLYDCCQWVHSISPKCTDERDLIYALLGLAKEPTTIMPNYSLSVTGVFLEFTWSEVLGGNIGILRDAEFLRRGDLIPSFVYGPDCGSGFMKSHFEAQRAGVKRAVCAEVIRPASVQIRGVIVDRISGYWKHLRAIPSETEHQYKHMEGGPQTFEGSLLSSEVLPCFHQRFVGPAGLPYNVKADSPTKIGTTNLLEVYREIQACAKRISDAKPMRKDMTPEKVQDRFWRMMTVHRRSAPPGVPENFSHERWEQIDDSLCSHTFTTVEGYMGKIPEDTEIDDLVVIFDGSEVPFVIRKAHGDSSKGWKLVGECYVDGWMDGSYYGHEVLDDMHQHSAAAVETDADFSYRKPTLLSEYFLLC